LGRGGLSLSGIKKGITRGWGLKRKDDFILRGSIKRLEKVGGFPGSGGVGGGGGIITGPRPSLL
jgi:hypothetical protein